MPLIVPGGKLRRGEVKPVVGIGLLCAPRSLTMSDRARRGVLLAPGCLAGERRRDGMRARARARCWIRRIGWHDRGRRLHGQQRASCFSTSGRDLAADEIIEFALLAKTWFHIAPAGETNLVIARTWPVFLNCLQHRGQFAHMAMSAARVHQVGVNDPEMAAAPNG